VVGYNTDQPDSDGYNDRLSLQRARAVMDYLMGHGVPTGLIVAKVMARWLR
jgi:outer membrane protein OmpA-like peptidoglycan-associated protein